MVGNLYKSRMPGSLSTEKIIGLRKCWRELELYKAPSVAMKSALELFFDLVCLHLVFVGRIFFRIEFDDRFHRPSDLLGVQKSQFLDILNMLQVSLKQT